MICPHCHRETDTQKELADQRWLAKLTELIELIQSVVGPAQARAYRESREKQRQAQKAKYDEARQEM